MVKGGDSIKLLFAFFVVLSLVPCACAFRANPASVSGETRPAVRGKSSQCRSVATLSHFHFSLFRFSSTNVRACLAGCSDFYRTS